MASGQFSNRSKDPRLLVYSAVKQIGKGSYGEVFLVKHSREKKQEIADFVVTFSYVMKNIKLTASSAKERLAAEQEAVLLGKLKHPNIVSYKESFQDEYGILHIVMGYCEGGDLCTRLKSYQGELLHETQVVEWFVQIALAIQYLHERNILHRDLKTQNIFLSKNDIIKVGDLGIARVLDGSCDLAHTVIGTPYYMSPELFANEPYNHKSDIWALGCCVYEMATLKHAFKASNLNALMYKIIKGKVPALPSVFSTELSELVRKMMAQNADHRPSVHQLLRNSFVKRHIKLFLDRAVNRKRKSSHKPPVVLKTPRDPSPPCEKDQNGQEGLKVASPLPASSRKRSASTGSRDESSGRKNPLPLNKELQQSSSKSESKRATSLTSLPQADRSGEITGGREKTELTEAESQQPCVPEVNPTTTTSTGESNPRTEQTKSKSKQPSSQEEAKPKQNNAYKSIESNLRPVQSSKRRESKHKRPPRPLPPDPVPKAATSTPSHISVRKVASNDSPDPPTSNVSVSSARERRRRNKQLEGGVVKGRVVLRSRSSSDLTKRERSEYVNSKDSKEDLTDGVEQPSEVSQPLSNRERKVEEKKDILAVVNGMCEVKLDQKPQLPAEKADCREDYSEPVANELHDSGSSDEVDEFLTLLDTTLHLPEPRGRLDLVSNETPQSQEAFIEDKVPIASKTSGAMLQSGRLEDRIEALKRECVLGLGEALLKEASLILDTNEPEEAEVLLLKVLGKDQFDIYAAKLQHLNLCEDTIKTSMYM